MGGASSPQEKNWVNGDPSKVSKSREVNFHGKKKSWEEVIDGIVSIMSREEASAKPVSISGLKTKKMEKRVIIRDLECEEEAMEQICRRD